jgi:hypothetical protein
MALVEYLHTTTGLHGTLEAEGQGYYLVRVEFDRLVPKAGFTDARRKALAYGGLLRERLIYAAGCVVGDMEGAVRRGRQPKPDLESTFVSFLITSVYGSRSDADMAERFLRALKWANQQWR